MDGAAGRGETQTVGEKPLGPFLATRQDVPRRMYDVGTNSVPLQSVRDAAPSCSTAILESDLLAVERVSILWAEPTYLGTV